jgi:hypothetical protein
MNKKEDWNQLRTSISADRSIEHTVDYSSKDSQDKKDQLHNKSRQILLGMYMYQRCQLQGRKYRR